ncbi:MAG: UDP-N-acetylmuramate dehydrogenase [Candidatus Promineifilaceae bacterium]|nr:UDP-N-acetylmuramate dehydrogenase [Candidatus Promineifilaceae bacterium]
MKVRTAVSEMTRDQFQEVFGDTLKVNEPLSRYTSARVGGPAEMFLSVRTARELQQAVEMAYHQKIPYFVLGGGSNILVADAGVSGLVILNRARTVTFRHNGIGIVCSVDSGMNLSSLARQCIAKGLGGLEWAVGIPGTIGGAVVGNAGAHGGDINGVLLTTTIWQPGHGVRVYSNKEMEYDYRDSVLKRDQHKSRTRRVVLSAELQLIPESGDALSARAEAFTAQRKQSQPAGASIGSMFKNPENYYAGYLIETAGLKGFQVGNARISEKHANFFISDGDTTSEEIRTLIAEAWNSVREQFNVEMELEVELVGDWDFKD